MHANPKAKLFITGAAWTTPLGNDLEAVWQRLLEGESGLTRIRGGNRLRNELAAIIAQTPLDQPPVGRLVDMAVSTIARALDAAGEDPADASQQLVIGTSLGAYLEDEGWSRPLSAWAESVRSALGLAAPPIVVSTACSSGSDAILVGSELLRAGAAKTCICGGVDVLTTAKRLAHSSLGTMSPSMLRAFDARHDGTLLGEGAAFLVMTASEPVGASFGTLVGAGSANDAAGMTAADTSGYGAKRAIERSLRDSGLTPEDIGIISAHGSGTPMNDLAERTAFREVFGAGARPLVYATKGNFGHSLGATGSMEAITMLLALRTGKAPPIHALEQPDQDFALPLSCGEAACHKSRFGLSLTLGFGGFDTSLVFEKQS